MLGKLGEGGMGRVYLAHDAELDRKIAIKLLLPGASRGIGMRRLIREAQGLARLSHPNVIQIHEIGEHDGAMFIAMEHVQGVTLREWQDAEPRTWRATLEILRQAGRGLDAAHAAGLIHRDFKPGNVIVGADGRARVLDFGLARDSDAVDDEPLTHESTAPHVAGLDLTGTMADSGIRATPGLTLTRSGAIIGTPAYMAPEQIQGQPCDPLSDQFSFCVTAFEALFRLRPFVGSSFGELAQNVAQGKLVPIPEHSPVPPRVQQAVLHGLSPNPAHRWPSMAALLDELDAIVAMEDIQSYLDRIHGEDSGPSEPRRDGRPHFRVPERLYGREAQVELLLDSFRASCRADTRPRMVLITGLAGIGKSSLVDRLRPVVSAAAGKMFAGKFDPLVRASPLAGVIEALDDLFTQLSTTEHDARTDLRVELERAAGRSLALLGDLVPALARLFDDSPGWELAEPEHGQFIERYVVAHATPERLNRIHIAITRLLLGLASSARPFVLFVDDLQWADASSLSFLGHLMSREDPCPLLVVGTCRSNEVGPRHPLRATLDKIKLHGASVTAVELGPLQLAETVALLEDTLGAAGPTLEQLARFALAKTEGNPFYLRHLLRTIHDEGLFHHDDATDSWTWDLQQIAASSSFDGVGEILARRLSTLPPHSLRLVQIAACAGQRIDVLTLSIAAGRQPSDTLADLWPTLEHGLLLLEGDALDGLEALDTALAGERGKLAVRFRHARIHEAASASLTEVERTHIHVELGRILQRRFGHDEHGTRAFDIADQLNAGRVLLDEAERAQLVELNLQCGRRALESGAHGSAREYLEVASELLPAAAWDDERHELCFATAYELARARALDGQRAEAKATYDDLLARAVGKHEKLSVNAALVEYALLITDVEVGYAACRGGFELIGLAFPDRDEDAAAMFADELELLDQGLAGRSPLALLELPMLDDGETDQIAELLHGLGALSYLAGHPNINGWIIARMVNLALRTGNSTVATVAYGRLCLHLSERGDYDRAQAFGELALALCERHGDAGTTGRVSIGYLGHSAYYDHPLLELLPYFEGVFHKCIEAGDLFYACHQINFPLVYRLTAGAPLPAIMADIETHLGFFKRSVPNALAGFFLPHAIFSAATLSGVPLEQLGLRLDHDEFVTRFAAHFFALGWYYSALNKLDYLLGVRHPLAEHLRRNQLIQKGLPGNMLIRESRYYSALSLLDQMAKHELDEPARAQALALIESWRVDLTRCAARCPANFRHKLLLLEAELERVRGAELDRVIDAYELAIDCARVAASIDQQALGYWRMGEFWRARGSRHMARACMRDARHHYQRWGAARMVQELDGRYPAELGADA